MEFAEPVAEGFRRITDKHEWLGEFYGSYKHSAPAIYAGYIGWFDGDPAKLDPPPRQERAARYVALMGGRDALLREAARTLDDGDAQWSAELTGWLVAADTGDREARALRADALRRWGLAQANTNWRNWALTAALELKDKLKPPRGLPFGQPDTVRTFPISRMIETMTVRLRAEAALDTHMTVAFETMDTDEACALEVRRGVCQIHADPPENAEIRLRFSRSFLESTVDRRRRVFGGHRCRRGHGCRGYGGDRRLLRAVRNAVARISDCCPLAAGFAPSELGRLAEAWSVSNDQLCHPGRPEGEPGSRATGIARAWRSGPRTSAALHPG